MPRAGFRTALAVRQYEELIHAPSMPERAAIPVGSGVVGVFCILIIGAAKSFPFMSGLGCPLLSVPTVAIAVGSSVVNFVQSCATLSSIFSQIPQRDSIVSANTPEVGSVIRVFAAVRALRR